MSIMGKLKKVAKKAAKKYGKTAIRAAAAYSTGGASEAYYAKAADVGSLFTGGGKKAKPRARVAPDPYSPDFGGEDPYSAPSRGRGGRISSRGIYFGG